MSFHAGLTTSFLSSQKSQRKGGAIHIQIGSSLFQQTFLKTPSYIQPGMCFYGDFKSYQADSQDSPSHTIITLWHETGMSQPQFNLRVKESAATAQHNSSNSKLDQCLSNKLASEVPHGLATQGCGTARGYQVCVKWAFGIFTSLRGQLCQLDSYLR